MDNDFSTEEINPDERATHAYLNKDGIPILCSWHEWKEWWKREGDRCQIKYDRIDDWEIETRFQGCSVALDGPPLFWEVNFRKAGFGDVRQFGIKEVALAFHEGVCEAIMAGEFEEQ
jgi:hypothetical protein